MITESEIKKTLTSVFMLIHVSFLVAILFEKHYDPIVTIFFIPLLALTIIAYTFVNTRTTRFHTGHLRPVLFVMFGAVVTFYLNVDLALGPVVAASLVGSFSTLLPNLDKKSQLLREIPPAIYCGAFIGMSDISHTDDIRFIIIKGFIAGILFFFSKDILRGFGGKLGTIAFAGVATTLLFILIF